MKSHSSLFVLQRMVLLLSGGVCIIVGSNLGLLWLTLLGFVGLVTSVYFMR